MGHPSPTLTEARARAALSAVLDAALPACAGVDYRLVGTAAALLRGVPLPAADIDLLFRDRAGVDAFAGALAGFRLLQPPVWLSETRQHYANVDVRGVEVGLSTVEVETANDLIETYGPGPWTHFENIVCGRYAVPAVDLELRLITELYRGRADRVEPLLAFMADRGCDTALITRGLDMLEMGAEARSRLLERLGGNP